MYWFKPWCVYVVNRTLAAVYWRLFTKVSESWENLGCFTILSFRPFGNTQHTEDGLESVGCRCEECGLISKGNLFIVKQVWETHYNTMVWENVEMQITRYRLRFTSTFFAHWFIFVVCVQATLHSKTNYGGLFTLLCFYIKTVLSALKIISYGRTVLTPS